MQCERHVIAVVPMMPPESHHARERKGVSRTPLYAMLPHKAFSRQQGKVVCKQRGKMQVCGCSARLYSYPCVGLVTCSPAPSQRFSPPSPPIVWSSHSNFLPYRFPIHFSPYILVWFPIDVPLQNPPHRNLHTFYWGHAHFTQSTYIFPLFIINVTTMKLSLFLPQTFYWNHAHFTAATYIFLCNATHTRWLTLSPP